MGTGNALRTWRMYLEKDSFTIIAGYQPKTHTTTLQSKNSHTLKRRAHWLYEPGSYDYVWKWKPGKINRADLLLRAPQLFDAMPCTIAVPSSRPFDATTADMS